MEATETFIRLSCVSKPSKSDIKIVENFGVLMYAKSDIKIVENFGVLMYDASCPHTHVNDCRKYLFSKLNCTINQCPPTKDALE